MMTVITIVSFCIHVFSIGYMTDDSRLNKYFSNLGFFTFSMLGIVISSNLLMLFIFWELVGFSSYLLIGFWSHRPAAVAAATKAFLMNRLGDIALLTGIIGIWVSYGTWSLHALEASGILVTTGLGLLIFSGIVGKSAQFPLFSWLPDAMEGPTPVSALIHAATMVAAGVFLLVRIVFLLPEDVLWIIACTGLITSLLGSIGAVMHYDVKKILAYSTISQLGLMVMAIGAGVQSAALLHLIAHAFFKALLFLAAGCLIHALHRGAHGTSIDVQDLRMMGGLRKKMPFTMVAFILGGASLIGLPMTGGFLSKEVLLESMSPGFFQPAFLLLSVLTVIYSVRLIVYLFFNEPRLPIEIMEKIREVPMTMRVSMTLLMIGCLWPGISINPLDLNGWMTSGLDDYQELHFGIWSIISVSLAVIAAISSFFWFRKRTAATYPRLILNNFGIDLLYYWIIVKPVLSVASFTRTTDLQIIDRLIHGIVRLQVACAYTLAWCDRTLVDGSVIFASQASLYAGNFFRSFSAGNIQAYIRWALLGLVIFIAWMLFPI